MQPRVAAIALLVLVSTVVHAAVGAVMRAPWIIPDEVLYSSLARGVASGHLPEVRGVTTLSWGLLYPVMISPAWLVFRDLETAYHAALAINSLVMSLVAIPAYLLARRFVSVRSALAVAALSLLVPSMAYTGVVMTENLFYPLFMVAMLAMARALELPSLGRQTGVLAALLALSLVRPQGLVLFAAFAGSILLYGWMSPAGRRSVYVRRFWPALALVTAGLGVVLSASWLRGAGTFDWLGSYGGVLDNVQPGEAVKWFAFEAAELVLYVAVAPIAAVLILAFTRADTDPRRRLFVALALPVLVTMLGAVAVVTASLRVDGHENVNERYLFYLVPLTFVGLALWMERGMPRPRMTTAVVLAGCCLAPLFLPLDGLWYNADFQSLALRPWMLVDASDLAVAFLVVAFTVACGLLWATIGDRRRGHLWIMVGTWSLCVGVTAYGGFVNRSSSSSLRIGAQVQWVDAAASGDPVTVLWDERTAPRDRPDGDYQALMVTEFFSRGVQNVLRLGGTTYYENVLPTRRARLLTDGRVHDERGAAVDAEYVLAPCRLGVVGIEIAQGRPSELRLYQVSGPVRVTGTPTCGGVAPGSVP